jgi:hypothetical protein
MAMFNVLLALSHELHPDAPPHQMSTAEFSLRISTIGYYVLRYPKVRLSDREKQTLIDGLRATITHSPGS